MIPKSLQALLGLCQRAGKAASGDAAARQALRKGTADLLIIAADASERTQSRWLDLAERSGVPCYRVGTRDDLGSALGKEHRAAVAIQSHDFAQGIIGALAREGLMPITGRG